MTLEPKQREMLCELVDALCDERLDDADGQRLATLLNDDDALWLYVAQMNMHAGLAWDFGLTPGRERRHEQVQDADAVLKNELQIPLSVLGFQPSSALIPAPSFFSNTISYLSSGWPMAYLVATVICGLGLLIGTLTPLSHPLKIAGHSPSVSTNDRLGETPMEFVAQVTGMVDCEWGDSNTATIDRAYVPVGRTFALASGLMEITYDTGAKVILQGPCTYEVESKDGGYLSVGKLTARVEKKDSLPSPFGRGAGGEGGRKNGNRNVSQSALTLALSQGERGPGSRSSFLIPHSYFAVRTPTAIVTDLGTEFGVEVSEEGNTTSHVFRGSVEVQPVDRHGRHGEVARLIENESVQVENSVGTKALAVARVTVNPNAFVRVEQIPKLAAESRLKVFRRWQAYSTELRRDPSLLAYYDFQQKPGLPSVLPNVAANGDESLDGVIENATWSDGRMPGKHALLFRGPDDFVRVNLPQKVDDLTLAAWINADSLTNIYSGILMSDTWERNGLMHWAVRSEGQVAFTVYGAPPIELPMGPAGPDRIPVRRWVHLAVVYDRVAARVSVYEDGQRKDDAAVEGHVPVCLGPARIGRWAGEPTFNLYGRIDELAVFGRALKPDEIQRMYDAGKPTGN